MDATQMISDSILESEEEEQEDEKDDVRPEPLAILRVFKNEHIPETELPLYLGENIIGRDPNTCTLPLLAGSISKQHTTISISVFRGSSRRDEDSMEALVWDLGSMNGTRKGHLKLTPHVRYALSEGDNLRLADISCQYISYTLSQLSGLGDRDSGRTKLSDAMVEERPGTCTDSGKHLNGNTKESAMAPLVELGEITATPVRTRGLSLEQTPILPQGTLVSESDSDSDGERCGRKDKRAKALVSNSDSLVSSPSCSTFLSPENKIVPNSEDECPITPSSSSKNRPKKSVRIGKEERDMDVWRQQLKGKRAQLIVDDSVEEEDDEREEERAASVGTEPAKSGQEVPRKQTNSVGLSAGDGLHVPKTAACADSMPAFNMDSDTDVEGEKERSSSAGPVTSNKPPPADYPTNQPQFYMDSDTDVDEDDAKQAAGFEGNSKPTNLLLVAQQEGVLNSDPTYDDGHNVDVPGIITMATLTSLQSVNAASTTHSKEFHLDSNTDVEDEDDDDSKTKNIASKTKENSPRIDSNKIESSSAFPPNFHLDSDTDDEVLPPPATIKATEVISNPKPASTVATGADLEILSDSDTDLEEDAGILPPVNAMTTNAAPSSAEATSVTLSTSPVTKPVAPQCDSDADTDVDESSMPPAGEAEVPADFKLDSDTDVEEEEEAGQIPCPSGQNDARLSQHLVAPLQNCSTPVALSGGAIEEMETQPFLSPSSDPFRCPIASSTRFVGSSSCSDSQEDDKFVVAETQSFIVENWDHQGHCPRDPALDETQPFVPELPSESDEEKPGVSSHRRSQAQALATANTQAFCAFDGDVNLEATQMYGTTSSLERTSVEGEEGVEEDLEATQAYGGNAESTRHSPVRVMERQEDVMLAETQAYIQSDGEVTGDENDRTSNATAETQPMDFCTASILAMAETQMMCAIEGCDQGEAQPPMSVLEGECRKQNGGGKREKDGEATHPQEAVSRHSPSSFETQPMSISVAEESDNEDSLPVLPKRRANARRLVEEEESQLITSSELSAVETQPMCTYSDETNEGEKPVKPPSPKRRGRSRSRKPEVSTSTHASTAEPEPVVHCDREQKANERPQRGKGREPEAGSSGNVRRGRRGRREAPLGEEEEQKEPAEHSVGQTKAKGKSATRGSRGKVRPEESEEERETEQVKPAVRRKTRQAKGDEREEKNRLQRERKEQAEKEESDKLEREERQRIEKEREEKEQERLGREKADREERERLEREVQERIEKESLERERAERERLEREEQDRIEKERKEQERLEREKAERERLEREQQDRIEKERKEQERLEREKAERERLEREEQDRIEKERKEQERLEREKAERERLEREERDRIEKERKEQERLEREKAERERLEREERDRIEKERKEQERLEREKAERERLEREERDRIEKERKEHERSAREQAEREEMERLKREEKERMEREKQEQEERERQEKEKRATKERERLERQKAEKEKIEGELKKQRLDREKEELSKKNAQGKETAERQQNEAVTQKEEQKLETTTRGRRATRRRTAAEPENTSLVREDVPAMNTRSRSNSSNSVSSERSSLSGRTSPGRGGGRGAKKDPTPAAVGGNARRQSSRRGTAGQETTEPDHDIVSEPGVPSPSNSTKSLHSDVSSCSSAAQNRGKGNGRGRRTAPEPAKSMGRGRKSRRLEASSNNDSHSQGDEEQKTDSRQPSTTRGRRRANTNISGPTAADEEDKTTEDVDDASEQSLLTEGSVRGGGQRAIQCETVTHSVNEPNAAKNIGGEKGRKRGLERAGEEEQSSGPKISRGAEKTPGGERTEVAEEEGTEERSAPVVPNRRGRASTVQVKGNNNEQLAQGEVKEDGQKMEDTVGKKARGRPSAAHKQKEKRGEQDGASAVSCTDQDLTAEASEVPQTPARRPPRKRSAPVDSSPVARTPRSSPRASPGNRLRASSPPYKVIFTGVMDESGERVVARLGGSLAAGVADMTCLVTDKVRRTVKFLCAVARGIPVVTTSWLEKSGKAASFLPPNAFIVKDTEQEKKFDFSLEESLRVASSQPLLQGYEIHVTKSVKPEPIHMKDIISCCGASFLPKMPSSHKAQTVVISCEEDWSLCAPALSASLPIVTAEFLLTGILQQKIGLETHALPAPATSPHPAGGRGRGRKRP